MRAQSELELPHLCTRCRAAAPLLRSGTPSERPPLWKGQLKAAALQGPNAPIQLQSKTDNIKKATSTHNTSKTTRSSFDFPASSFSSCQVIPSLNHVYKGCFSWAKCMKPRRKTGVLPRFLQIAGTNGLFLPPLSYAYKQLNILK